MIDRRDEGPVRVLFGVGAEAAVVDELRQLGAERALLICAPRHREGAERLHAALGAMSVGVLARALPQVPIEVAQAARAEAGKRGVDWILAHGGGTSVGLAKAVALELDVSIAAIPTTYSGSEMTDIWGVTAGGIKTTGRAERVRPKLVAYDPTLLLPLRPEVARSSLFNALAHAVEGLYAVGAGDELKDRAERACGALVTGLLGLHESPGDLDATTEALRGAMLSGQVLGGASMALHHKLCHVLGGSFGTPHAETHAVLLPHTLAYNSPHAPGAVARLRRALGAEDPAGHLWDVARRTGTPTALSALGFPSDSVDAAVDLALLGQYPNPRPVTASGLRRLLEDAVAGRRPRASSSPLPSDP